MRKLLLLGLVCILASVSQIFAQNRTVTGKVTSAEDSSPLPGVNVTVKGSTLGTSTDADGTYSLAVPDGATLVFSFVGFTTQEVSVGNQSAINITLQSGQLLTDVVVVGYGTQEKADLTGNIAKVSGNSIQNIPVPTFEQALQGRAAGVFVESNNGKLGQGIKVRVRGSASVSGGNQPLYVIDGIPMTSQSQAGVGAPTNPLADLNFNDVESVVVLKDAGASAIYGSQASGGVVLITTKKGKAGKTNININAFTGFSEPTGLKEWLNTAQYTAYFEEARANSVALGIIGTSAASLQARYTRYAAGDRTAWETPSSPTYTDTDWQSLAFQDAPVNQVDLSASGGTDKTRFYTALSWSDQYGILISNRFRRLSGRINVDHKASDKLSFGINLNVARSINNRLADDNAFSTPLQIVALPPMTPAVDPRTGQLSGDYTLYYNPLLDRDFSSRETVVYRSFGKIFADYNIIPSLTLRSEMGFDLLNQVEERYFGKETARNSNAPNGLGSNGLAQVFNYTTNNYLTFNKTLADVHAINVVAGLSYQDRKGVYNYAEGQQFPSSAYKKLVSAADKTDASSSESQSSLLSYFARANYKFNNRYLVEISGRIDGSSRFGVNNRYGFFPAVSAGWIISEESFMQNIGAISFLKLRASYGLTGNDQIGDFSTLGLYSGGSGYAGTPGQSPAQIANPDLKWEQTTQTDIGIEYGFLQGRITGELDYYNKQTEDLLLNVNVPSTSGFTTQLRNVGKLENKGFEVVVNTQNFVGTFKWNTGFNFSRNRNNITFLQGQVIEGGFLNRAVEGQPIGVFFGPKYAGVDVQNGDALYFRNVAEGTTTNDVNEAERVVIGDPNPDFIAGITNEFSFKGFDLSVLFQGVFGNQIYNGGGKFQSANGDFFDNQTTDQLGRWQKPGDVTDIPQARLFGANGTAESSRYLSDGTYVRLKTLTFGYSLPASLISKIKLAKVRVYASGQNLLTFTKYKGWDPEVNTDFLAGNIGQGNDFYAAPQLKTITFGINVGF